jgi:hypothetical protein
MNALKRFLGPFCILVSTIAVCGAAVDLRPVQGVSPDGPRTISETLQVLVEESLTPALPSPLFPTATLTIAPSPTPTLTSSSTPAPTETSTPAPTDTATATSTPAPPTLSVSAATNCRTGPGNNYGIVYTMRPGIIAVVVGQDIPDSYWIVAVPGYPGTVCWLWSQYALVTGDTSNLPSPATPLASNYTLSEPKNLRASCSSVPYSVNDDDDDASAWTVVFRWVNTEPNQTGVRVFRNSRQIATLGSRASSCTDYFIHYDRHSGATYRVQAFNASAVSSIVSIHMNSCRP